MSTLTPEEEDALYDKLWGPNAPKPWTHPTTLGRTYSGTEEQLDRREGVETLHRGGHPDRTVMHVIRKDQRRAMVLCANRRGPGRPYTIALVTTWAEELAGSVITVNPRDVLVVLGADFRIECRCGMTHEVDGGRLRSAVLALPRRSRKTPTINVYDVERVWS